MALRNAFDGLATETTLRRLFNTLAPLARDTSDRLRVIVDNAQQMLVYRGNTTTQATADNLVWYNVSSWNVMDPRDQMRSQTNAQRQSVRNQRWVIT